MSNAKRDENTRPTVICSSENDGNTVVLIQADPSSHFLSVEDATTGSDNGNNHGNAMLDDNGIPVWTALSSAGNGSIIEIYADPITGSVLTNSS